MFKAMPLRDVAADKQQPLLLPFEDDEVVDEIRILTEAILIRFEALRYKSRYSSIIFLKAVRMHKK
jgi:hypothetical protein